MLLLKPYVLLILQKLGLGSQFLLKTYENSNNFAHICEGIWCFITQSLILILTFALLIHPHRLMISKKILNYLIYS